MYPRRRTTPGGAWPACPAPADVPITILYRTNNGGASAALFANGRGRRILNRHNLSVALGALGAVTQADPGALPLREQHLLMLRTRVLITRMSSTAVGAMFMPPGGVAVEIEAPDPSSLYNDHPSMLEELAEIYGHAHYRSSDNEDARPGMLPAAVIGDGDGCKGTCKGPVAFRGFPQPVGSVAKCVARCEAVMKRETRLRAVPGLYLRPLWYQNWWILNAYADVPEVLDLVRQGIGCP